ncbi:ribosomal-protein-alanine N-acetyltransferase [Nocardia sp. GAS34]|uniref:GNAT family N-acetyltransferase n=1 Tax=unclassified Nocardia TaxID=2637762 RepID=UPI003D24BE40
MGQGTTDGGSVPRFQLTPISCFSTTAGNKIRLPGAAFGCELDIVTALAMPVLTGENIRLRAFAAADVGVVVEAGRDPLIPLITSVPDQGDEAAAHAFIQRQHDRASTGAGWSFAIVDLDTDTAIGHVGLWRRDIDHGRASVGYWVGQRHRSRGYAARALRVLTCWGVTLQEVSRLELYVEPWNEGSWRAAESAGYQREGLLRRWQKIDGRPRDMYMYAYLA